LNGSAIYSDIALLRDPGRLHDKGAVSSTMDVSWEMFQNNHELPLHILASRQLQGRGRQGRVWHSPQHGNMHLTSLIKVPRPLPARHVLPLALGLVLHHVVVEALPPALQEDCRLKWPNDLVIQGKKLAGILIETRPLDDHFTALAIGIGLNCAYAPQLEGGKPTACLADYGLQLTYHQWALRMIEAMAPYLQLWLSEREEELVSQWLTHSAPLQQRPVQYDLHSGHIAGRALEINRQGYLSIKTPEGRINHIAADEVFAGMAQR
jgi:BirA family biotin operon repressor/biotin-[acetyl-CoA-carboxylase] ligase